MSGDDKTIKLDRDTGPNVSPGAFQQAWVTSGLHTEAEVKAFFQGLTKDLRTADGKSIAQHAVREGWLTRYQAQSILVGKTKALVLGSYVILDKLGQGGMGQVFRAKHRKMGRVVAIKVLPNATMRTPDAIKRFHQEIQAAAKLSHPNIVTAHDAGESNRVHYLVMEYVDGMDLRAILRKQGPLPVSVAVDYVLQTARGLDAAHRQGIIHRDIKPENLLLDSTGTVKILDMGLARISEAIGDNEGADESLTRAGQVLGTPDFMAPEQGIDTKRAEARSDIYSLGCTLHMLLVGRPPYGGTTIVEKILAHRDQEIPSLRVLRGDVPESLDRLFRAMLAKRPDDRPASMKNVIEAIQTIVRDENLPRVISSDIDISQVQEAAETWKQAGRPTTATPWPTIAVKNKSITQAKSGSVFSNRLVWAGVSAGLMVLLVIVGLAAVLLRAPLSGTVTITADQDGGMLSISDESGKFVVDAAVLERERKISLPPTRHQVTVSREGFETFTAWVEPKAGVDSPLRVTLKPIAPSEPPLVLGSVQLTTNVEGAEVKVAPNSGDESIIYSFLSGSDPERIELPPGRYRVTASKIGYVDFESTITILAETQLRQSISMSESPDLPVEENQVSPVNELPQGEAVASAGPLAPAPSTATPVTDPRRDLDLMPQIGSDTPVWAGWNEADPEPAIAPFDARKAVQYQRAWAKHLGFGTRPDNYVFTNSIGMRFVLIPPGEFFMGASPEEIARLKTNTSGLGSEVADVENWGPSRRVIISRPYFMAIHELTRPHYFAILGGPFSPEDQEYCKILSAFMAADFCSALAEREGLPAPYTRVDNALISIEDRTYRLPTEAEWEFAARAGATSRYWYGDDPSRLRFVEHVAGSEVGEQPYIAWSKQANAFGLYDVLGNLHELTMDTFDPQFMRRSLPEPWVDPRLESMHDILTIRGGYWKDSPDRLHVAIRAGQATHHDGYAGVRLVLDVEAVRKILEANPRRR